MISQVAVNIVAVVLESLLYGLLLIVFSTNLYLRITRYARPQDFVSRGGLWWNPIVISNIAIFATCTAHWIINVERFFLAFLGSAGDPLQFYCDESQPTSVANNTLVIVVALIGDAVIVSVDPLSPINIYCTTFIAWRIWKTSRVTGEVGGSLLMPVFVILIESAAIWTTWTIFFAATFLTGSPLAFIGRDLMPLIIGVANLLIHLRVGLG
ncbi:hypothetical protein C8R44DRAFT_882446 [Mycena epipterygia]|nr:hypothetical protein C8R44DRAFT_882446 [Mycena epipterygia]